MITKNILCTIALISGASVLSGQTIIEQWDYTNNSLAGVNGNQMTFVNTGNTDVTGGAEDNTFTVNRVSGSGSSVLTGLGIDSDDQFLKVDMTIASWDLTNSGGNGLWAIHFRDASNTSVAQLRFQAHADGTRVTLDNEFGQITDSNNETRTTAIGGFVSASQSGTAPVTISLTLGLADNSYLLESNSWSTSFGGQQSGTIANLSDAVVDNFRWVWSGVNDGANGTTDYIELDQIVVQTVPEPSTYALLAGLLSLTSVMIRRRK